MVSALYRHLLGLIVSSNVILTYQEQQFSVFRKLGTSPETDPRLASLHPE
jgi:hypothetical protein